MPQATNKFYIGIKNEASTNTLELYFLDYIYNGFDWSTYEEKNMVADTIAQIKAANPSKVVLIINSLGGDVMIGLAIYNYLKASSFEVETRNIGFAASIASVMLMAGKTRKMAKNAFAILHAAWSYASGNAAEMRQQADNLDKVSNELADIYAQASGKHDAKHFTDMWANGDVWLTAQECLEMGLITEVTGEVAVNASVDVNSYGFKNIPAALLQAATPPAAAAQTQPTQQTFLNQIQDGFMKIIDQLKAAVTGGKENKTTDGIAGKQEILDMVQAVLTPFAEAVDKALDGIKPAAATEEKPAATTEETTVETPATPTTTETPAASAENAEVVKLRAEMETLKKQIANSVSKPSPAKGEGEAAAVATMKFETE